MTWLLSRTAGSGDRSISCTVRSSSWYALKAKCILGTGGVRAGPGPAPGGGSQALRGGPRLHLRAQVAASFLSMSAIS